MAMHLKQRHSVGLVSVFFIVFLFCTTVCADTIYLVSGDDIEGTIVAETEERVIINIGSTDMTFFKRDIDRIERSAEPGGKPESSVSDAQSLTNATAVKAARSAILEVSSSVEQLYARFRVLYKTRWAALRMKRKSRELYKTCLETAKIYLENKKQKDLVEAQAEEMRVVGDTETHDAIMTQVRTLVVRTRQLRERIRIAVNGVIEGEKNMFDSVYELFYKEKAFFKEYEAFARDPKNMESYYAKELAIEAKKIKGDFTRSEVAYTRDLVVKTLIDGAVPTLMRMDVNVPVTVITQELADALSVDDYLGIGQIELPLFGTETTLGTPVWLSAIAVGDIVLNNVLVVVVDYIPYPDVTGILGGSFMAHFTAQVDKDSQRVVMHRFMPE